MNYVNMRKLITHLEWLEEQGREHKFDMGGWIWWKNVKAGTIREAQELAGGRVSPYSCNTRACLAGHAAMIGGAMSTTAIPKFAQEWLGLRGCDAIYLFYGDWAGKKLGEITLQEAIAYLHSICPEEV